jgi:predicted nucleotidyltransferase
MTAGREPSRLFEALRHAAETLNELRVPWALVGGLAISVRAEPRFTRDIDLAVAVGDDAAAERLVADLSAAGFRLLLSLEHAALGRLASVRLLAPGEPVEGVVVDLLFASSGIEPEICRSAEVVEIVPDLRVPVARVGHLVATKILAEAPDRPQDAIDLVALARGLSADELERARGALRRIEALGANRGKALLVEAGRWLPATT